MRRALTIAAILTLFLPAATARAADRTAGGGDVAAYPALPGPREWVDFTLPDADGGQVSLGRFIGKKPVLLIFWATWCAQCKESFPVVNRMHTEPPTRDALQILALDFMESREKVGAFVAKQKVSFPVLLDRDGSVARKYQVVGIPTYVLIDRKGEVAYRGHELPGIETVLE